VNGYVAGQLAEKLELRGQEYALGGAIALGYWGTPRGTVDVDLTVYLPPEQSSLCGRPADFHNPSEQDARRPKWWHVMRA